MIVEVAFRRAVLSVAAAATALPLSDSRHRSIPLQHDWQRYGIAGWQIRSDAEEDPGVTDVAEGTRGHCPAGMVDVEGGMAIDGPRGAVDALQDQTCVDWIAHDFPERCAAFDEDRWRPVASTLPRRSMHFCIDRFEYPNRKGAYPVVGVTWRDAAEACGARGERLCHEDEWTFACEGTNAQPYPYGYRRDPDACVIDRPWRLVDEGTIAEGGSAALRAIDALWQGEASGSRPGCRSPFGVFDTTGNVDEWTRSVETEGLRSILKGGYWGPVRSRCRPSTRVHGEDYAFYQEGFRCCSDAPTEATSNVSAPATDAGSVEPDE